MTTGDNASLGEWLVELGAHPPVAVWVIKKMAGLPSFWTSSKVVSISEQSPSLSEPFCGCHNWRGTAPQLPVL